MNRFLSAFLLAGLGSAAAAAAAQTPPPAPPTLKSILLSQLKTTHDRSEEP